MKKIISVLILTLLASSCNTRLVCEKRRHADRSDSISSNINTVTVIRDTTIYVQIPGDTVFASIPLAQFPMHGLDKAQNPAIGISRLRTPNATSSVWVKDGRLNHRLEQKDTTVTSNLKGALKTSTTTTQKKQATLQTVTLHH